MIAVVAALAVLAGAGLLAGRWLRPGSPQEQALDRAREAALERAQDTADRMEDGFAYKAAEYAHDAGQADGVEVMSVDGAGRDSGDGVTVAVRSEGSAGVAGPGGGEVDELQRALPAGEPVTQRSLRAAVQRLPLDPRVVREVGTFDGGVVAGVLRATRYRCLMMQVTSEGELQTWVPSRISVAPGESDCTAGSAAGGTGR